MERKVREILENAFPGIDISTEMLPDGRITGSVVWAGFTDLDHVDRQSEIRALLREKLGADAQQVGVLLADTPDELEAMNAA
jgi:hypothetical protein